MSNKAKQLDTPCVGICSTVYGDDVCRGCKRFSSEIINWNALDAIQKQKIFDRLGELITKTVAPYVAILDAKALRNQLNLLGIRYRDDQSAFCDVYYLLRAGASQIKDTTAFGFEVTTLARDKTLLELFTLIEKQYLETAQHYFNLQRPASTPQAPQ